ncbi:MAG: YgiT-type zinc finger protein, partial [Anaerolineales bacterium]|nr:YgiT-type zinc finger protein [Anaerolineales bacterium]
KRWGCVKIHLLMPMICTQCRIGRLHDIQAPYIKEFQGQMLVFSNVPAGRCDVCDEVEYDMAFMTRLLCLLDPEYMAEAADIVKRHTPQPNQAWHFL